MIFDQIFRAFVIAHQIGCQAIFRQVVRHVFLRMGGHQRQTDQNISLPCRNDIANRTIGNSETIGGCGLVECVYFWKSISHDQI